MAMNRLESGLYVESTFKKAAPPKTGPAHGDWQRPMQHYGNSRALPGGGLLQFDLDKLTLDDFRSMREHYQINISLAILTFTMHQLDWSIECEDPKIASFIEENLAEVWTRMVRGMSQSFWAGFSPMVLEYENDSVAGKVKLSKFKDLIPEECDVNWKTVDGATTTPSGVRPKRYVFDGIKQAGRSGHIPVENSLWWPVLMENGNMAGRKLLRPAFPPWFFSQIMHLYSNRYFERFGEPVIVGRAPLDDEVAVSVDSAGVTQTQSGKQIMEQIVSNVRNSSSVVLPSDRTPNGRGDQHDYEYSLEYLEGQMRGADFDRYLQRLDEEMSLAMFAPVLLFRTADVGSYNLGQAHEKLFFSMMNGLVGDMAEYLERYALGRLVDYNFSPKAPRSHFKWRQLGKDRDETVRAIVQAVIQSGAMKPSVEELGAAVGMEFHEVAQAQAPEVGAGTNVPDPNDSMSAMSTASEIVSRIRAQAHKHWDGDVFADGFSPSLGFRRKMEMSLAADRSLSEAAAHSTVENLFTTIEHWIPEAMQTSSSPDHFADKLDLVLTKQLI